VSTEPQPIEVEPDVKLVVHVSLEMVRLYKEHFGRPKMRAHTGRDRTRSSCFWKTRAPKRERNMVEMRGHERLRDKRVIVP